MVQCVVQTKGLYVRNEITEGALNFLSLNLYGQPEDTTLLKRLTQTYMNHYRTSSIVGNSHLHVAYAVTVLLCNH